MASSRRPWHEKVMYERLGTAIAGCFVLIALAGVTVVIVGAVTGDPALRSNGGLVITFAVMFGLPVWGGYGIRYFKENKQVTDARFRALEHRTDELKTVVVDLGKQADEIQEAVVRIEQQQLGTWNGTGTEGRAQVHHLRRDS